MSKKSKKPLSKSQKPGERNIRMAPQASKGLGIDYYWVGLGLMLLCYLLFRIRLIGVPFERDEGEYAYIARLLQKGIAPFVEAYTMKLPGTSAMYAIIMMIFGPTFTGVHIGLMIVGIATIILLFLSFRKLFNPVIALFAAGVFAIMSLSPTVLGFAAHATHFITFFVSLGLFFISRFYERRNVWTAFLIGLLFGLAFLMKQQAVFFLVFGGIAIILGSVFEKPVKIGQIFLHGSVYSVGVLLPYLFTVLIIKSAGSFETFWFWTISYAGKYAGGLSLSEGLDEFGRHFMPIFKEFPIYWILCFAGIVLTFFTKLTVKQKVFILLFSLFAFLSVCPGLYFRRHYFIVFLPAIGLLGGVTLYYLTDLLNRSAKRSYIAVLPFIVFSIAGIAAVSGNKDYYFKFSPTEIAKQQYGNNPFNESIEIADYIKKNSTPSDRIAVLGSEPQIAFYADRLSASGYIYTYPLVEIHPFNQKMQDEMVSEIEKNKPLYIVYCLISASWLGKTGAPSTIFSWFNTYAEANYQLKGVVDIYNEQTNYAWDAEALTYTPQSDQRILIYRRKE